jgi:hypothetical protein
MSRQWCGSVSAGTLGRLRGQTIRTDGYGAAQHCARQMLGARPHLPVVMAGKASSWWRQRFLLHFEEEQMEEQNVGAVTGDGDNNVEARSALVKAVKLSHNGDAVLLDGPNGGKSDASGFAALAHGVARGGAWTGRAARVRE